MKTYYKILFVLGLLFETIGQVLLTKGNEFIYALRPIDFAHWLLLIGVILLIPQIGNFRKSIFTFIGVPFILIGIMSIIGMCVLDFIWWSQPTQEIRNEFTNHISKVPSIWKPFISTTPKFLNIGLFILSLNYLKEHKIGVSIIILATIIKLFGGQFIPYSLVFVYLLTFIGFVIIFFKKPFANEH
jgi:hypothetical protein